jgi:hypothetical protein
MPGLALTPAADFVPGCDGAVITPAAGCSK